MEEIESKTHEKIIRIEDKSTGLVGFLAIHNTKKGPAVGGTRYWAYSDENEAREDALRLSKAMTYKCALARIPFGGGKGVIIAKPGTDKSAVMRSYAKCVNKLGGLFYTGEDVGLQIEDILTLAKESPYIIGTPEKAGDPSPWAALSVAYAMEGALEFVFKDHSFNDRVFSIKGLGKVGFEVARMIHDKGGAIIAADMNSDRIQEIKKRLSGIRFIASSEIHKQKVDVYVPCALGKEFSEKTIKELSIKIVCGAANNQLSSDQDGERLHKKGILYVPDYLANSGGLINVVAELNTEGYSRANVYDRVMQIKQTTLDLLKMSQDSSTPTSIVADRLAEEYIGA